MYTYGIDLTKEFSDNNGNFDNVKFLLKNATDNYYVQAELNKTEGVYYVTGHTEKEADAMSPALLYIIEYICSIQTIILT